MEHKVDISVYTRAEVDYQKMRKYRLALEKGEDASSVEFNFDK